MEWGEFEMLIVMDTNFFHADASVLWYVDFWNKTATSNCPSFNLLF